MNFDDVIGHETLKQLLIRSADRKRLPNSYLFVGPEGVGKWAMALAYAAYLNCQNPDSGNACGTCPPCRQIARLQYPDLFIAVPTPPSKSEKEEFENYWEILKAKIDEPYSIIGGRRQMSIPVATVREIRRSLAQKPATNGIRVVLIDQMERMLQSSGDALLKLIEEPPPHSLIIITSSRPERLLPTVVSRCREVRFPALPEDEVVAFVQSRKDLPEKKVRRLARLARGSPGRALRLAADEFEQNRETSLLLFKGLFGPDSMKLAADAADLLPYTDRHLIKLTLHTWQSLFRDIIALRCGQKIQDTINVDFSADLEKVAGADLVEDKLLAIPQKISSVVEDIDLNVDTRTAMGALLIALHDDLHSRKQPR
jgi:DNA polymerase-3 subunit delta'